MSRWREKAHPAAGALGEKVSPPRYRLQAGFFGIQDPQLTATLVKIVSP